MKLPQPILLDKEFFIKQGLDITSDVDAEVVTLIGHSDDYAAYIATRPNGSTILVPYQTVAYLMDD